MSTVTLSRPSSKFIWSTHSRRAVHAKFKNNEPLQSGAHHAIVSIGARRTYRQIRVGPDLPTLGSWRRVGKWCLEC